MEVSSFTRGGATLSELWGGARKALRKASASGTPFNVVVLQEDLPETTPALFLAALQNFVPEIRAHGAEPILFMAWAYDRLRAAASDGDIERAHATAAETHNVN
eukprot:CAMPEP_0171802304 /NCGR_PEP_ID=MMETSP0991-20121206/72761_1 /TAXON_ID=483369 /ORGANISM="non described non described, Strain CCMP2098" /LENGTH=103 /DNA_ID=CAMNT_0012414111 /DNA_START=1 /DNA_END=309 /DNA_ORIENTATION=-